MKIFTRFSFTNVSTAARALVLVAILFSWNGNSQNIFTNPGLDAAAFNCAGADADRDEAPDGWIKTNTPDRSTALERSWDGFYAPSTASPNGGCYYGFRALGGAEEGIGQNVPLVGGETYSFSFDYLIQTRQDGTTSACTPELQVKLDGATILTFLPPATENVWETRTGIFVAPTGGTVLLEFFSGGTCDRTWNFVDGLVLEVAEPELQVTKTVSPTGNVSPNDVLTYTIEVENTGLIDVDAANVSIQDLLPAGVTYTAASATKTYWVDGVSNTGTFTHTMAPLNQSFDTNGITQTYTVTTADIPTGSILTSYDYNVSVTTTDWLSEITMTGLYPNGSANSGSFGGNGPGSNTQTGTGVISPIESSALADYSFVWIDSANPAGNSVVSAAFTIGYDATPRVQVTDAANAPASMVTAADLITLEPGETMTVTFAVTVDAGATGTLTNNVNVTADSVLAINANVSNTVVAAPTIVAEDDDFSGTPFNPITGGTTGSVFADNGSGATDLADGSPATDANIDDNISISNDGGLTGVTINNDGTIAIPALATPGTYTVEYTICLTADNSICTTAEVIIEVGACLDFPTNDCDGDGVINSADLCEGFDDTANDDSDAVPNGCDNDSDNDGVTDVNEGFCVATITNGSFEELDFGCSNFSIVDESLINGWEHSAPSGNEVICGVSSANPGAEIEIWGDGFLGVSSFDGSQFSEINAYNSGRMTQVLNLPAPGNYVIEWGFVHRGRSGVDEMRFGVLELGSFLVEQTVSTDNTDWVSYSGQFSFTATTTTVFFAFESVSTASGDNSVGNFIDFVSGCTSLDTDGDGTPDYLDRDSDNDNCPDVTEAGFTESTTNSGEVEGTGYDSDGLVIGAAYSGTNNDVTTATQVTVDAAALIAQTVTSGNGTTFTITSAIYNNWAGGQPGNKGITVNIVYTSNYTIKFDSIYFSKRIAKLESNKNKEKKTISANFRSSVKPDIILDKNTSKEINNAVPIHKKFPFELKQNEAIISYIVKGKTKYFKVKSFKKGKPVFYPSAPKL